ncbi:MFS transporter [Actinokineospora spheciospongiae]|uniref:MFS transporter n=1 Tax=Actinokineospora spheciospongiae TaxID=909613 RepID=UPI000D8C489B|nr:MFS transporter [Actinokineospora spheciospongiae]PWW62768.1 MFS transporter [Actinokineospora spheciospongiae]
MSTGVVGMSVTAFSLAYLVGAPLGGAVADRVGRRGVLVAGLTGFALANALTAVAVRVGVCSRDG